MSANIRNDDPRIIKTHRIIIIALSVLLEKQNFGKITVRDICEEALISRATFYAHFTDKYDFLKCWLISFKPNGIDQNDTFEKNEKIFNEFVHNNKRVISNLISDADIYTLEVLYKFITSSLILINETDEITSPKHIVLANFYAGGMLNYLTWQVRNNFPSDVTPMNIHLYKIIQTFMEWK